MPPAEPGKQLTHGQKTCSIVGSTRERRMRSTGPSGHEAGRTAWRLRTPRGRQESDRRFILARLESEGLKPSPEADRRTLIRRVSRST